MRNNSWQYNSQISKWIDIKKVKLDQFFTKQNISEKYYKMFLKFLQGVTSNNLYFNIWSKADIVTGKVGKLVTMEKVANASYKLTKNALNLKKISDFETILAKFNIK